jgi:hypothetical protein
MEGNETGRCQSKVIIYILFFLDCVLINGKISFTGNLSHTKTRDMIPVDLNGFLYWNAIILEEFCQLVSVNMEHFLFFPELIKNYMFTLK